MRIRPGLRSAVLFTIAMSAGALGALGGCYKHVVRSEGITSRGYDVYEPNRKEDLLDKADKAVWDAYDGERK